MPKIFLTHPPEFLNNYYGDVPLARLREMGEVRLNPAGRDLSTAELIDAARGAEIIVTHRHVPGDAELFNSLPDLIAFCRCAMDIRNVNIAAASANGILVTHASAGFIAATAEWIVGSMIALGRGINAASATYQAGQVPIATMGRQLKGSTLGIIGHGQIGRYLSELGLALGMKILVADPYVRVSDAAITQCELPQLLTTADFVVCLAAATEETENLMNAQAFGKMKSDAFFINASRGNLVDETALVHALDQGQIAGCAMDVGRAPDHQPSPSLARHPKVIATPHIGGLTPPAIAHQALETVEQVREISAGRAPTGAVNAEAATRLARMRQN